MLARNCVAALGQPVDHCGAGAALALPQQALIAGQIDEPGVPWVDPHPPAGVGALLPAGFSASGLIDAEHCTGSGSASSVSAWATNARCAVGHDTAWVSATSATERAGVADRRPDLGAQPPSGARPRRDLRDGLGERGPLAVVLPAPPPGLVPAHHDSVRAVGDVLRRGGHPGLHRRRHHPARRARRRRLLGRRHVHHPRPVGARSTRSTRTPGSPNNNVVPSDTALGSLPPPECFATFRLRKTKGLPMQRHAL